ncbi:hypothetical protein N867_07315 [Actinotalea fermentans ATCC 43279 = JCM 9966 = DSM 3133]|nr:hypothetical protein N867_07315 [Actinotalea fermentans ATCC 43279 = JCM 9966 = DSM 3133]
MATSPHHALRDAVEGLATLATGARSWDAARRRTILTEVDRAIAGLTAVRSEVLLAERDSGDWRGSGDPSFAAWRGRTARVGVRGGAAEERRAETLTSMREVRDATLAGSVSVAHVDVIGQATARGSQAVRDALGSPEGQARVLQMARRLDAGRFATALARMAASVDAAHVERTHQAQRAERFLHLAETPSGTRISGQLDSMAGHRLRLALEALSPRPAADDSRGHAQRTADALEALADTVLSLPSTGSGAAVRPHVSFLMTEETWGALRALRERGAPGATGPTGAVDESGPVGSVRVGAADEHRRVLPPATLEDGTPVPMSELARVLCDCELTRIVMDAQNEPVNLGRTARTYTGAQRRGVIARDGGCAWQGCGMAARWCEVHHRQWWDRDGGETSVEDGVLLCSFHHHEVHRLDLSIRRWALHDDEADASGRRVAYEFVLPGGRVLSGGPPGAPPPRRAATPGERVGDPRDLGGLGDVSAPHDVGRPRDLRERGEVPLARATEQLALAI